MGFWNEIGDTICKTVDTVMEKNKKAAQNSRLKLIVKNESDAITRAYIALGQNYYKGMRDDSNEETECLCQVIDHAKVKINKVKKILDEINLQEESVDFSKNATPYKTETVKCDNTACAEQQVQEQSDIIQAVEPATKGDNIFGTAKEAAEEEDELIPPLTDLDLQD